MFENSLFDEVRYRGCRSEFKKRNKKGTPKQKEATSPLEEPKDASVPSENTLYAYCRPYLSIEQGIFYRFMKPLLNQLALLEEQSGFGNGASAQTLEECLFHFLAANREDKPDMTSFFEDRLNALEITVFKTLYLRRMVYKDTVFNYKRYIESKIEEQNAAYEEKQKGARILAAIDQYGQDPAEAMYSPEDHDDYSNNWR